MTTINARNIYGQMSLVDAVDGFEIKVPDWLPLVRGDLSAWSVVLKFGRNAAVDGSYVPVCLGGFYRTPQAGQATKLRIKAGGNALDTAAGTGAREIYLAGLDSEGNFIENYLATAGASASALTTDSFMRLMRLSVTKSGTYATQSAGSHAGTITIENQAGDQVWGIIDDTELAIGQSEIGAYSIPAGYRGFIELDHCSIDTGKTMNILFFQRENILETAAPYSAMNLRRAFVGLGGGVIHAFSNRPVVFGPVVGPADVGFLAKSNSGGVGSVSIGFNIYQERIAA